MNKVRKEFERLKKRKDFYEQFGGKDSNREIHHKVMIQNGGKNDDENLVFLTIFWHRFFHKLFDRGEIDNVNWRGKKPSTEKQIDDISDALIQNTQRRLFIEDVKNELKSRG